MNADLGLLVSIGTSSSLRVPGESKSIGCRRIRVANGYETSVLRVIKKTTGEALRAVKGAPLEAVRRFWAPHTSGLPLFFGAHLIAVRKHLGRRPPAEVTPIRSTPAYSTDRQQHERRSSHCGPRPGMGEVFWSRLHQSS